MISEKTSIRTVLDGERQRRNQFLKTTVVESEIERKKIPSKKRKIGDHFHGEKLLNCEFLLLLAASTTTILLLQITHKYFHENSIIHV